MTALCICFIGYIEEVSPWLHSATCVFAQQGVQHTFIKVVKAFACLFIPKHIEKAVKIWQQTCAKCI